MDWSKSIPAAPNGPHLYTRELIISNRHLEKESYRLPESQTLFLQHLSLFRNVQVLTIECTANQQTIDTISVPCVFGHLFGTLRSLTIRGAFCSPQALISLIASFPHLEDLDLEWIWFTTAEIPRSLPDHRAFKGTFRLADWNDSSEEFASLLAEHDLRYREMCVNGECWLLDTAWNRCLAKCAEHLERLCVHWSESDCKSACCWLNGFCSILFSGSPGDRSKALEFQNLRSLKIYTPAERTAILPPPEFFSSITSIQLSEIIINTAVFPPGAELDEALNAIWSFDEIFCQLGNQLDPSLSGSEKLVLTLVVVEELPDPAAVLPRFSKVGILKMEETGM